MKYEKLFQMLVSTQEGFFLLSGLVLCSFLLALVLAEPALRIYRRRLKLMENELIRMDQINGALHAQLMVHLESHAQEPATKKDFSPLEPQKEEQENVKEKPREAHRSEPREQRSSAVKKEPAEKQEKATTNTPVLARKKLAKVEKATEPAKDKTPKVKKPRTQAPEKSKILSDKGYRGSALARYERLDSSHGSEFQTQDRTVVASDPHASTQWSKARRSASSSDRAA